MALQYSSLNKHQKLAAFLIAIGPESAGRMMRDFEDTQIEILCREIAAMPVLDAGVQREVLREFAVIVANGVASSLGGVPFARLMLGQAKDEGDVANILGRCTQTSGTDAGSEIRKIEGAQLLSVIKNENPQTIALVVSCMEPVKAAELVGKLTPELREEVVERLGKMEGTSQSAIAKVAGNLIRHVGQGSAQDTVQRTGGVRACVEILHALTKDIRKTLVARLEERDETLGAEIRKQSFCFEDLLRLSPPDLQRVLREVDSATLPVALKGVKAELVNAMLNAMSKRAAQSVRDEIAQLGPLKVKDVEAAQGRVVAVVRKLEESEEITLDSGPDDNATI
jgi:flagellar motor switch protein FliG